MTARYLAFHAADRPQAVALVVEGRAITFAEFERDLGKVTRALHALNRPPGSTAAVRCADVYFHWLLLLGFERLAVTTVSIDTREGEESAGFIATIDLLISDGPLISTARAFQPITSDWCQEIWASEPVADASIYDSPVEAPVRIIRTSGTTAEPKRMFMTRAVLEAWLADTQWHSPFAINTRSVMTLPMTVVGAYTAMNLCLRCGGTTIMAPFNQTGLIPDLLTRYDANHLTMLPAQLKQLLEEMPADFPRPAYLRLATFGGALGPELRAETHVRLAEELTDIYGTNEAGFISMRRTDDPDGVGVLSPNIQFEVVDDLDAPLPEGQAGWVRVKGAGLFQGYLDDPETNRRMLRDGWFYPGDVAVLLGNRRLKILGRGDELLNVGGIKFGPDRLEDRVRAAVRLADIGVCAIRNRSGIGEVYLGVVKATDEDEGVYGRVLELVGTFGLGVFYVIKLDRIPRNANGKILRKKLKRVMADEILRHDPVWTERVMLDPGELGD